MKRRAVFSRPWLLPLAVSLAGACDGREIPVFDVPLLAGAPGASGAAGAADAMAGAGGSASGASGANQIGGSPSVAGAAAGGSYGGVYDAGTAGVGGGGAPPVMPCASAYDCKPGWQCEKPSCDAVMGECVPRPFVFCPPDPAPVCGCDGVTYWNDCVRRQTGAQLESVGECGVSACPCDIDSDCADDSEFAVCAHLVQGGDTCHSDEKGVCWVLPPQCKPNATDQPSWRECRPPDLPPAPCVDTCQAIASGHTYKRQKMAECIPPQ
jgi:hypothetical protein